LQISTTKTKYLVVSDFACIVNVSQMSFNYRYLLCISGLDGTENLEIYKTYMHFGRIADYGKKAQVLNPPNFDFI
jgi:hypothetical protein